MSPRSDDLNQKNIGTNIKIAFYDRRENQRFRL